VQVAILGAVGVRAELAPVIGDTDALARLLAALAG
jgi:hypothetical protein